MKKLLLIALLGFVGAGTGVATAGTAVGNFNVNITLTSVCQLTGPADLDFAYTSFQPGASAGSGGAFSVQCTNLLPYTIALDQTAVIDNAVNLAYTLGLSAAGGTGTGVAQAYSVTGSMAASQAGNCATGSCTNAAATNKTRTLTITY
jgi:Spore Coat Protein U domain